jgi:trans-aconitate methyltransferase
MSLVTSAATKTKKDVRWNAEDYAANSAAQQTWARELIAQLHLRGDEHILDVGCGDGKVTAELARAVPKGSVAGIDASPEMIRFARKTFPPGKHPNLKFQIMDAREISLAALSAPSPPQKEERAGVRRPAVSNLKPRSPAQWLPKPATTWVPQVTGSLRESWSPLGRGEGEETPRFDVVFSSSVLHWVADHPAFLRGAAACLRPSGRLVVSCGGKGNAQDVFVALRPEMRLKQWCKFFRKLPKPYFFHRPAEYEKWLPRFGFKTHTVKLSPKDAVYPGRDRFVAWFRTTWLPYTQRVPENLREEFVAAITDRYLAKHPPDAEGRVHVRMVRLEIDAVKV